MPRASPAQAQRDAVMRRRDPLRVDRGVQAADKADQEGGARSVAVKVKSRS
jgi:hypothetical protein